MSAPSAGFERAIRERIAAERGKPAVPVPEALDTVRSTHAVDFAKARARAGFSRGHLIDVVLALPGGDSSERERNAARALIAELLGQALSDDWLGDVSIQPAPRGGLLRVLDSAGGEDRFFPVSDLPRTFERAIAGLYAGLPDRPFWSLGGELLWTMLEASAEAADDYAAQNDLLLASTYLPEMLKCFLGGSPFASRRFSRHGELFAYLKAESSTDDPRLALSARRVLEDALDAALVSERAGRVVGSGLGIRYSYVDFAFSSVEKGIAVVSDVARRVGLSERSWILFCDTELEDEWAAVHPRAPAPPRE